MAAGMTLALALLLTASPVTATTPGNVTQAFVTTGVSAQPVSTLTLAVRGLVQVAKRGFDALPTWLRLPASVVALFGVQWVGQGWLEQAADPYRAARDFWARGSAPVKGPSLALATF